MHGQQRKTRAIARTLAEAGALGHKESPAGRPRKSWAMACHSQRPRPPHKGPSAGWASAIRIPTPDRWRIWMTRETATFSSRLLADLGDARHREASNTDGQSKPPLLRRARLWMR